MVEHVTRATDLSADRLRALIARVKEKGVPEAPIRPRRDREGPLPLSFAQERLWVLDRLGEGNAAQAVVSHLRLAGRLAPAALARTLAELARRHETLRTTFGERGGVPFQEIAPAAGLPIDLPPSVVDLAGLPAPVRDREMLRLAGEEARRPFDLARGPLLRNLLLRLGPEDHMLAAAMHRAVSDAGSMAVLAGELVSLYAAFSAGLPSPLPEPALQYADFALWQRERLEDPRLAPELAWWSELLAGLEPLELLPTDRPRPPVQSFRGARRRLALSPATAAGLRELGQREGATPLMVLLTLWQVLLCRWSAQTGFAVGLEVAHRDRGEVQGMIGPLAGTLPLRAGLAGRPGFRELLRRTRQAVEEARAHEVPFEKLVEHLQSERLRDRHPLFQVGCALRDPEPEVRAGALRGTPLELDSGVARLDLDLTWSEREGGFEGTLVHSADLFDGATVQRLLRHHLALVRAVLDDPERWVEELPLLSAAERAEALAAGTGPAGIGSEPGPPADGVLHALFEEQAALRPDAVAVESEDGSLTYAGLDARANQLARTLRRLGAGPDAVVGFHVPRSLEMIIGLLGIFKAGAAYLPLDSSFPRERMDAMIGDCRPVALLTLAAVEGELPEGSLPVIRLDADRALLDRESPASLDPAATAGNLAFVLYTSGSTGRPKGVMVPHRGLLNRFLHDRAFSRLGPRDAMLHKAPLAFDLALWEAIGAFTAGGRAVLARPGGHVDFPYLARLLDERQVTLFHLVPSLLDAFLADPRTAGCGSALRQAYTGGEAVTPALRDRFFARFPCVPLDNQYGPTEASIDITWQPMRPDGPRPPVTPIGFPHPHCAAHVLAPSLEPLPVGVPGEICLGGVALARGYLNRPDLTAERFIPDPFGDGERLYLTGDLARRLPAGSIEYLGRIDHQVKIRGVRIEPGEIEAALLSHPRLREAAVVVHEGSLDRPGKRLVACFSAEEPAPDARELRALLARMLPETMIPAAFVRLPALPRLASDKIDRRALARIVPPAEEPREHVPPRTPVEIQLAAVWSDLLGIERVGANDGFFALGGHSLLAMQLVSRLRDQLGVEIPVRALFEEPTLAGLAGRIELALGTGSAAPPIPRAAREGLLPLSFAQERLWFLEQLEPGSAFYNIPAASRLTGPLRIGVLRRCVAELARRHESLRTVFGDVEGRPYQEVRPEIRIDVPLVDLSGLPEAARDAELLRQAAAESRRPFDLTRGPLFRTFVQRLGPGEHVLVPTLHHIISDGWSMTVLLREIAALYEAFSAGRPPALPELPIQYADYAVWQRGHLQGEALAGRLAWWRERLAGVSGLQLPTDRPRPPVETFRGRQRPVAISPPLTRRLHELGSREGVTLFMTLLALFQTVLLRATGQTDLPVGSPIANRPRSETEGVIGFFANTVVLRTSLSGDPAFRELLRRVREVTVGAYAHEDLPFEKLVEELQPERDMSRNPLFQVMCVLQNQPWPAFRMGDVELAGLPVDTGTAKFDLTLFWREEEGGLNGLLEHNSDLFDDTTARRLYRCFEALLAAALDDPAARIGTLPLLGEAERHQLLREWSGAAGWWPGSRTVRCVHRQVEKQVARTPGAPAVVDGGRTLTYAELDERANRLARGLARRGVRPEALVGICVERSLEMVVAALAVLKAGGALVALDPAYPRERLATIIDDARLAVLLTQESLLQHFPQHAGIALLLERGSDPFPDESAESPGVEVELDHPIYAIYTSGSTGQPKGILVTHRAFASLLAWQLGDPGLHPGARTVQLSTFGFCVSFQEMFSSWCSGGVLAVADEMTRRDLAGLAGFLEEQEIDRLHLPFAALKHLAEAVATEAPDRRRLPSRLRTVITAGEQLQVTPAVRSLFELLPSCTLSNQYGASETHVVSALTLSGDPSAWPAIPPVGWPVANVRIHLLDAELAPVPIGVAGELFAGGACLPRGYLNDPALTAQKLVPDPYSSVPGARLYRTGDAARHLTDGRIEYHGRIDTQVKIRGFRVELGEVETVLARHPGVRDAAVVARPGRDGQRLVAYVVPADAAAETVSLFVVLRTHLKQRLPDHMIPSAFVEMPYLPLNANGKLDSAALPEPEPPARQEEYVAPRTPVEELIAGVWAEVLGLERVGVRSDFFDLGGHSLLATQVVARVRQALGVDLGLRTLFEARTVEGLTVAVAEELLGQADADAVLAAFAEAGAASLEVVGG